MARTGSYNHESFYDNYLGGEGPRYSTATSTTTGTHLSVMPPMPRPMKGRQTVLSAADTASVYTTATTPFERWSLEQGLDPCSSDFACAPDVDSFTTARPPNSPALSQLRSIPSKEQLLHPSILAPTRIDQPIQPVPSPANAPFSRRHFSRPL